MSTIPSTSNWTRQELEAVDHRVGGCTTPATAAMRADLDPYLATLYRTVDEQLSKPTCRYILERHRALYAAALLNGQDATDEMQSFLIAAVAWLNRHNTGPDRWHVVDQFLMYGHHMYALTGDLDASRHGHDIVERVNDALRLELDIRHAYPMGGSW